MEPVVKEKKQRSEKQLQTLAYARQRALEMRRIKRETAAAPVAAVATVVPEPVEVVESNWESESESNTSAPKKAKPKKTKIEKVPKVVYVSSSEEEQEEEPVIYVKKISAKVPKPPVLIKKLKQVTEEPKEFDPYKNICKFK